MYGRELAASMTTRRRTVRKQFLAMCSYVQPLDCCVDVWGSMMDGYVLLYVAMCGLVSSSVAMCRYVQPCVAMGAGYVDMRGCVQLWVAMCCYMWLCVAKCG